MKHILVVGAGFSGAVLARELAERAQWQVTVIDARDHVAGNCHTERDPDTGVMVHRYGPHIFHTDDEAVWTYVRRFGQFAPFVNRVKASIDSGVFSLPINLHTINQFFGKRFSPTEARAFVAGLGDSRIGEPQNFEEQALKHVGRELYEAFFHGYTLKQWGCEPRELPAAILRRLPVRFDYNDSYYDCRYQGMPVDGYSDIVARILAHSSIRLRLGLCWEPSMSREFDHVFFTGPIDAFFAYSEGRLSYRTVYWERSEFTGDFQGNAVINYPDPGVPYTRIHEHHHFAPWEHHERSVVFTEYSMETGVGDTPYYPKRLPADLQVLEHYRRRAGEVPWVTFLGRLGTYRYLDMHHAIGDALRLSAEVLAAEQCGAPWPQFPGPATDAASAR